MFIVWFAYFIIPMLIFTYSLYSSHCFIMRRTLEDYKILNVKPVNKKRIIILSIARLFMLVGIFYASMSLDLDAIQVFAVVSTLLFGHMLCLMVSQMLSETRSMLIKFAVKNSDIPISLIEFKVDMHLLLANYHIPDYLEYYTSYGSNKTKFIAAMEEEHPNYPRYSTDYFPLLNSLAHVSRTIDDKDLDCDSSLVNMYFIKNITLLTTMMSILKDKKLVTSLCSDEGVTELVELSLDFLQFNTELESLVVFETKEIKESKKAKESNINQDNLDSVRSMRNFI